MHGLNPLRYARAPLHNVADNAPEAHKVVRAQPPFGALQQVSAHLR